MNVGKRVRLGKIFGKDGKTFIVAVDHPTFGQVKGLEKLSKVVNELINYVDGFIANPGALKSVLVNFPKTNVVLTIPYEKAFVEYAVKLGAVAVKTSYFGSPVLSEQTMKSILEVSEAADEWGIPYILEIEVTDDKGNIIYDPEQLKLLCRAGEELGADIIKASYIGPIERYAETLGACNIPVIIRGGEKMEKVEDFVKVVSDAIKAGASGAAIGRNVWGSKKPAETAKAIYKIIHENISVKEAIEIIQNE